MSGEVVNDLEEYRAGARRWVAEHLASKTQQNASMRGAETEGHIAAQRALQRRLFEAGWAGIDVPAAYGGQGRTAGHAAVFADEARGYHLPDFGILSLVTYGIALPTILAACSESFKKRHVPRILAGEELWCQLLSEPGAGSDLAGILTKAVADGDRWIVNGTKVWSSGALFADYGLCITRTDWDAPKHHGLTWMAMPLAADGATVRPIREVNGGWEFCEVFLDDVVVDGDEVMGAVNEGWRFTHTMLVYERGALRGDRTELPVALAPDLVEIAETRGTLDDSHSRQLIATGHIYDVVRAALTIRTENAMRSSVGGSAHHASYLKLAKGIYDPLRAKIAMDLAGDLAIAFPPDGIGTATSTNFLNGRVQSIAGGSNEMQRNGIAEKILGLPKEMNVEKGKSFRQVLADARKW
ncbi:acyl-CoA dehydrogenase family protein [Mycolicibacterium moriokaense]|uniref:Alkylation response protein AidB-like acyl-CoA dehydrogenase n=1 Tax=Mycolicibacterium moriokaense TaxID=39691 RepID=A0A318H8J7_9MYCO|nr:acyl-CoA dehydrogenase family protein [Mycolicibacterium moriokaense]PXX01646.1 alkylation response protein AidB-like acyl-CoA dehydrogenase [Mycolicibacterium moriokaense]